MSLDLEHQYTYLYNISEGLYLVLCNLRNKQLFTMQELCPVHVYVFARAHCPGSDRRKSTHLK